MDDAQLLRYSRHILLDAVGVEAQQVWLESTALVVGLGGLGSPASMYLASAGVGRLLLADGDTVDTTNLQRQVVHRDAAVGLNKAESAAQTLSALNPDTAIECLGQRLDGDMLTAAVARADVVLDCSDNFATRYALNAACAAAGKPLVSGAGIGFSGQLAVFDFRRNDGPCYRCLFADTLEAEETRCAVMGVFAPLVGVVGTLQACEALKLLADIGTSMHGRLMLVDALGMEIRTLGLPAEADCPVCATRRA
ncbi:MAG: molybdopterin-synthase adenylyltransferase MoeB [Betaproteobacteria bacterium]|jgi:adenylyltransferase/sulfurtransferase|nr:molybdopterin-synthase adenylyltransferase MoeB [Betaproteobacteria bacterium]NCU94374.1 molybdopterin-synthase adenylyltransferase MoeB [Betaproteobacteria bacterium]